MRALIFGFAVVLYAAALAIAGAGMRLPVSQSPRDLDAAPVQDTAPDPRQPAPAPVAEPLAAEPPPGVPTAQLPAAESRAIVENLAREQATNRQLVTELRDTVSQLQEELARQSAALQARQQQGRTIAVVCCELLPAGKETLAPEVEALVRSVLPEIMADTRRGVSVEGHSDSRPILTLAGKPFKDNADLSLMRARAVADLLQRNGVEAGRIRVEGWGDTRPITSNETAAGRDRNRRVEILLLPPAAQP